MLSDQPDHSTRSLSTNASMSVDTRATWMDGMSPATSPDMSSPYKPPIREPLFAGRMQPEVEQDPSRQVIHVCYHWVALHEALRTTMAAVLVEVDLCLTDTFDLKQIYHPDFE